VPLGSAAQIPVGGGAVFQGAKVVVTQPEKGVYKAFSSTCTHAGCQVGHVTNGAIVCPCHGSRFGINDGSVQHGPAARPLPGATVIVKNGQLFVSD
jgi:nitrite reductase/ring-hydroxylating ferredoxin subunit